MHKIYFLLLLLLFSPIYVQAQELDETYLSSLPEDIRKDIEDRINENNKSEEPTYRLSEVVTDLQKPNLNVFSDVYGSQFFESMQTSFMPINTPNLDDSYILDFGDILSIQLIGQQDLIGSYQLQRDGAIKLPDIGQLNLAGLSLAEASSLIKRKVKQTHIGTEAYISLESIRDVSVLLAGDVYNPGVYTLNGNSNMLHAIHVAGGIGEFGSYRSIKLIRNEKIIEKLDIYDILIHGKLTIKTRLRSGDIIFVDPRHNLVSVEGAFKREGVYELLEEQNLLEAVKYANGISVDADKENIFLHRVLDSEIKSILIADISYFQSIPSIDNDKILVRRNSFRNVNIQGAVKRPGNYKMVEGDTVFDLIELAGGYTQNAFPKGAIYLNEEAKEINIKAMDKLYEDFLDGVLNLMQQGVGELDFLSLTSLAEEIKNITSDGRIIIDLLDESEPILIREGDSLIIPEKNNNVFMFGEVLSQGALKYSKGANLDYYISEASGLKETASDDSIYIMFPDGRTQQYKSRRNLFANTPKNIVIEPGSVIYVPRRLENAASSRLAAQAYATILGNVSLALASLKTINDK